VENADFGGRLKLWSAGLNAFVRKPIMGHGVSGFKMAVTPELGILSLVAHNSFLSILVEEGLVGLALFLLMLLAVFLSLLRLPHLEKRFGLVLLLTLCAAMTPLTWEDNKAAWLIMALLVGMTAVKVTARRVVRPQRRVPVRTRPLSAEPVDPATVPAFRVNRTG
jgi:O-antigen ligase